MHPHRAVIDGLTELLGGGAVAALHAILDDVYTHAVDDAADTKESVDELRALLTVELPPSISELTDVQAIGMIETLSRQLAGYVAEWHRRLQIVRTVDTDGLP